MQLPIKQEHILVQVGVGECQKTIRAMEQMRKEDSL